jgi:rhodanese-related sulfurtransferase
VTASEAVRLINHEKAVVIDVSEPGQFAALHVGGARSVPLGKLEASPPELPKNKSVPLLVYGVGAGKAVAILKKQGFEKAMQLTGGVGAWQAANLPVEKSA